MSHAQRVKQSITTDEKLAWLRLTRTENVGPVTFYQLVETYGGAARALEALPEISKRGGRKKPLNIPDAGQVEREYERLRKNGGEVLTASDNSYPLALGAISDAPPVISILGNPDFMNRSCVALVGARNASLNGRKFAQKLAGDLGKTGQMVVSGMACGIDTAAHEGALETGTIAVLAGGIDIVYPEENRKLYDEIREKGLIIAESPLGQKPFAQSFPRRNRIVSGLSKAVIIVEATLRSGSLITARLGGEQGRDIMAVPGSPYDPRAQGPNYLIRQGATLIRNVDDVLETLTSFSGTTLREENTAVQNFQPGLLSEPDMPENAQQTVLENLSFHPVTVDELIRACHLTIPVVQTILLELELAGRIKRSPGNRVCLLQTE